MTVIAEVGLHFSMSFRQPGRFLLSMDCFLIAIFQSVDVLWVLCARDSSRVYYNLQFILRQDQNERATNRESDLCFKQFCQPLTTHFLPVWLLSKVQLSGIWGPPVYKYFTCTDLFLLLYFFVYQKFISIK